MGVIKVSVAGKLSYKEFIRADAAGLFGPCWCVCVFHVKLRTITDGWRLFLCGLFDHIKSEYEMFPRGPDLVFILYQLQLLKWEKSV